MFLFFLSYSFNFPFMLLSFSCHLPFMFCNFFSFFSQFPFIFLSFPLLCHGFDAPPNFVILWFQGPPLVEVKPQTPMYHIPSCVFCGNCTHVWLSKQYVVKISEKVPVGAITVHIRGKSWNLTKRWHVADGDFTLNGVFFAFSKSIF